MRAIPGQLRPVDVKNNETPYLSATFPKRHTASLENQIRVWRVTCSVNAGSFVFYWNG